MRLSHTQSLPNAARHRESMRMAPQGSPGPVANPGLAATGDVELAWAQPREGKLDHSYPSPWHRPRRRAAISQCLRSPHGAAPFRRRWLLRSDKLFKGHHT